MNVNGTSSSTMVNSVASASVGANVGNSGLAMAVNRNSSAMGARRVGSASGRANVRGNNGAASRRASVARYPLPVCGAAPTANVGTGFPLAARVGSAPADFAHAGQKRSTSLYRGNAESALGLTAHAAPSRVVKAGESASALGAGQGRGGRGGRRTRIHRRKKSHKKRRTTRKH